MKILLQLCLAYKFTVDVRQSNELIVVREHEESLRKKVDRRRRDLRSLPTILFPLGRSQKNPTSQLGQTFTLTEDLLNRLCQKFDPSIVGKVALLITILAISLPRLLFSGYMPPIHLYARLVLESIWFVVTVLLISRMGQNQSMFFQMSVNTTILVVTEQIEFAAIYNGSSDLQLFGTFELMAFLMVLTKLAFFHQTYSRVKQEEKEELASQEVINRLVSTLFSDSDSKTGHAILHLGEAAEDYQLNLLRCNRSFVSLLGQQPIEPSSQSDSQGYMLQRRAMTHCLEEHLLCKTTTGVPSVAQENLGQNFKTVFKDAIKRLAASPSNGPHDKENFENGGAVDLFSGTFKSMIVQAGKEPPRKMVEIKTHVLCDVERLYLVKISETGRPECAIDTDVASLTITQLPKIVFQHQLNSVKQSEELDVDGLLPTPILKRKPQPKRVSFDSLMKFGEAEMPRRPTLEQKHSKSSRDLVRQVTKMNQEQPPRPKPSQDTLRIRKEVSEEPQPSEYSRSKRSPFFHPPDLSPCSNPPDLSPSEEQKREDSQIPCSPSVSSASSSSGQDATSQRIPIKSQNTKKGHASQYLRQQTIQPNRKSRSTNRSLSTSSQRRKTLFRKNFLSPEEIVSERGDYGLLEELQMTESLHTMTLLESPQPMRTTTAALTEPQIVYGRAGSMHQGESHRNSGSGSGGSGGLKKQNTFFSSRSQALEFSTGQDVFLNLEAASGKLGPGYNPANSEPSFTLKRVPTMMSHKSAAPASPKDSKVFMFKIIHDLRHPTQAFKDGLLRIIENAGSFVAKNNNQGVIKGHKFLGDPRVDRIVNDLHKYSKQFEQKKKAKVRGVVRRTQSTDTIHQSLRKPTFLQSKDLLKNQVPEIQPPVDLSVQSVRQKLKEVQNSFWNLPLQNFIIRPPPPQQNLEMEQPLPHLVHQDSGRSRSADHQNVREQQRSTDQLLISVEDLESSQTSQSLSYENSLKSGNNGDIGGSRQKEHSFIIQRTEGQLLEESKEESESGLEVRPHRLSEDQQPHSAQFSHFISNDSFRPPAIVQKHTTENAILQHKLTIPDRSFMRQYTSLSDQKQLSQDDVLTITNSLLTNSLLTDSGCSYSQSDKSEINFQMQHILSKQLSQSRKSLAGQVQSHAKVARMVRVMLSERRKLILLLESHMKKRLSIKKQSLEMQGQVEFMSLLLTDLMNFAMLKSNTFTLVKDYFNCAELVKKCFRSLSMQCKLKGIRLMGPVFDKPIDSIYFRAIFGDEQRYKQIITNFLTNGIKFTPRNGIVSVLLRLIEIQNIPTEDNMSQANQELTDSSVPDKEDGNDLDSPPAKPYIDQIISFEMIFRDSGCGISEENQTKLFASFSKIEENQEFNKQGVGLGLSICREIINANGGSVAVKSELGQGTDFIISLQTKCRVDLALLNNGSAAASGSGNTSSLVSSQHLSDSDEIEQGYDFSNEQELTEISEYSYEHTYEVQSSSSKTVSESEQYKQVIQKQRSVKPRKKLTLSVIDEQYVEGEHHSQGEIFNKQGAPPACLVANDCPFVLKNVKRILSKYFEIVDTAQNGQEAVDLVSSQPFYHYDVIVLDYDMPEMDGSEACIEILKHIHIMIDQVEETPKLPNLYALTQETNQEVTDTLIQAGFRDIMSSLTPDKLKMIMEDAGLEFKPVDRKNKAKNVKIIENQSSENSCSSASDDSGY